MKIDTEILESHQAKLNVTAEPEQFDNAKKRAARQLSKQYKIAGFRPGKAPYPVVVKHLGEGAITEQAIEHLIDEIYPKAIEEAEINPYGPGSLEEISEMDPPTFVFLVPLAPEVELSEYKEIRIDFESEEVTDEDVEKILENIRDSQAVIEPVERKAKEGDMVYVVLSGERKDEEDEEKKELLKERRYPLIIEKKDSDQATTEYPFPGFSRKLIGLGAGDEKTIEYKFKKDYEFEDLRGVTGVYQVKIEEVKGRTLPEVTDEFVQSLGEYENVDALLEEIKNTLTEEKENEQISEYDDKVMEQLIDQTVIKYPPEMLEHEIEDFIHGLEHQLANQGLTMDIYLKSRSFSMEDLKEEVREPAKSRLKRSLILMEIANAEEIEISSENVNDRVRNTLAEVTKYYSEDEAKRLGSGENLQNLISRIATDEVINQTLQRIRDIAMGKEIEKESAEDKPEEETEVEDTEAEAVETEAVVETAEEQPETVGETTAEEAAEPEKAAETEEE